MFRQTLDQRVRSRRSRFADPTDSGKSEWSRRFGDTIDDNVAAAVTTQEIAFVSFGADDKRRPVPHENLSTLAGKPCSRFERFESERKSREWCSTDLVLGEFANRMSERLLFYLQ